MRVYCIDKPTVTAMCPHSRVCVCFTGVFLFPSCSKYSASNMHGILGDQSIGLDAYMHLEHAQQWSTQESELMGVAHMGTSRL